jgi:intracellular multiplication protein IcmT
MKTLWRESGRTVRFFIFDGRSAAALVIWFAHWSWWTFYIAVGTLVFFAALERFNYTLPVARRKAMVLMLGKMRRARPWWRQRYYS